MRDLKAIRRILRGRLRFVEDHAGPAMYHARTLRSDVAAGRVVRIRMPESPDQIQVVGPGDIPGKRSATIFDAEIPILADGAVRYVGEPLLLFGGPDPRELDAFLSSVRVEYDDGSAKSAFEGAVVAERTVEEGEDLDLVTTEGAVRLSGDYRTGPQDHDGGEPTAAVVELEGDRYLVHSACRWPFNTRANLAAALAVPEERVVVRTTEGVDRSFDGRLWFPTLVAAQTALVAMKAGKPARLLLDREEDFLFGPKRAPMRCRLSSVFSPDGRLLGLDADLAFDLGAYPILADELVERALFTLDALYHPPNRRFRVRVHSSNLPPLGFFAGLGDSQVGFCLEAHLSEAAHVLGMSPVALRLSNAGPNRSAAPAEILSAAATVSNFERKFSAYELVLKTAPPPISESARRGVGVGMTVSAAGFLSSPSASLDCAVEIRLDRTSRVTILQSAVPQTHALCDVWKQTVVERLQMEASAIAVESPDTSRVPDCGPICFSRAVSRVTRLVEDCCDTLQRRRFRQPLPLTVTRKAGAGVSTHTDLSWATCVVEVEVDLLNADVRPLGVWMVIDAGRVFDTEEARDAVERGIFAALGACRNERVPFIRGRIPSEAFRGYRITGTAGSFTPLITFVDSGDKREAAGVGDLAQASFPPAFAAAVCQASGRPVRSLPLDGGFLWEGGE